MSDKSLKKLNLPMVQEIKRAIPAFDSFNLRKVGNLSIAWSEDCAIALSVKYIANDSCSHEIVLALEGVRSIKIPEISGDMWLTEFNIVDVSDQQLEGIRYEVVDEFDRSFLCLCAKVAVKSVRELAV